MSSITMTASFLGGATASTISKPSSASSRGVVVVKASSRVPQGDNNVEVKSSNGRRELVAMAAAAAVACSIAKVAMADEDVPKRGTPEARKKFAPVCVTMPTARICHQ